MKKDRIFGWASIFFGILYVTFFILKGGGGIVDLLAIFAFFYIPYKTIYKNKELTKSEWIAAIFLYILVWIFPFILVFLTFS